VCITYNIECQVVPLSTIGGLIEEARLSSSFMVDWAVLRAIRQAGYLGEPYREFLQSPEGRAYLELLRTKRKPQYTQVRTNFIGAASPLLGYM
jgi:hypothetical protein